MAVKKPNNLNDIISIQTTTNINLNVPSLYLNRELSWLQFNQRVLEEALDDNNQLLERVKFLAIFANNLDEFFMIRVSGLLRQLKAGVLKTPPDGLDPSTQLRLMKRTLLPQLISQAMCWNEDLKPKLFTAGIKILHYRNIKNKQRQLLRNYFETEIFPTLTPLAIDPGHPFPHISNLSLNLVVVITEPNRDQRLARLKVPDMFPRLIRIPEVEKTASFETHMPTNDKNISVVWIEELIAANLDLLFPGLDIIATYPFRVTRDADLEIEEDEANDLLACIQENVDMRRFGSVARLEIDETMPDTVRELLINNLKLELFQVYATAAPIGMANLMELTQLERFDLKDQPFLPMIPPFWANNENIFNKIRSQNILLYHPYDSFTPVIDMITQAAKDPNVLAIKQTLYRVGKNSPIVTALIEAREHGKQVAVLVELKARFDEENNIGWAIELERAGVHVVYGVIGLKTHTKMCLIVRRESDGITRYVHLGTGNYNPITSKIYTDFSYFTCDPEIATDVSDLFNALTGYSRKEKYHQLLVAPASMRQQILARINREIDLHRQSGDGYLAFKMNALVDTECIQALYRASQAGVKIDLQVRSICCLRPGVPGVSENITVTSIVGRFLEHSRIYYFHHGGADELLLGSADLMPRNLDRRIEILFPITSPLLKKYLLNEILQIHLRDNVQARLLLADGRYQRVQPKPNEPKLNSQMWMLHERRMYWIEERTDFETTKLQVAAAQADFFPREDE
jgi:polyphosphate kinase